MCRSIWTGRPPVFQSMDMELMMTKASQRSVTFSPAALQKIIAEAVKLAMAGKKADNKPAAVAGKTERSIQNEIKTARAFKKAGFADAVPHVNVKTFNRWMAEGRRPIEGTKSIKVANLRLFHVSQTRAITLEEREAMQAQNDAAVARHDADKAASNVTNITEAQ